MACSKADKIFYTNIYITDISSVLTLLNDMTGIELASIIDKVLFCVTPEKLKVRGSYVTDHQKFQCIFLYVLKSVNPIMINSRQKVAQQLSVFV